MSRRVFVPFAAGVFLCVLVFGTLTFTDFARSRPIDNGLPDPTKVTVGTVRDFGARGDGTTDDWQAIQNAVNARNGSAVFPHGIYRITKPVTINLNRAGRVAIRGSGTARIVMAGAGPAFKFIGTHTGTADPDTVKSQVWNERMPVVEGIEIVGDNPKANGIEATGTMQLTIARVLIRKCHHGIHLTARNRNVIVANSHIYENSGIGIFMDNVNLHQINVTGCHVSYCDGGGVVCRGGQVRNIQIAGCDLESNQGKDGPATANVFIDSTGGSNAEVAITGCTIQHNHTAPGSANIRILGPVATRVKGTDEMRDGHITIAGNVLSDVKVNLHLHHARGVVVTGNTFWTGYEHNILAEHSSCITIGSNNFDRNPRYASEEKPSTANDLVFRHCSDCSLTGFLVTRTRAAPAAVTLETCDRLNVANLTILDSDAVGLLMTDVTNSRVGGCLIRDDRPKATSLALKATGGRGNFVVGNAFGRPTQIENGTRSEGNTNTLKP